ncbi:MAG: hypothetical protein VZQ98_09495 [Bacteroidales bacterium]|nr:hypothetical protein [Bacteroidales bacterium]
MADIELVIKIPEESYKNMKNQVNKRDYPDMQIGRAIAEGTPLPKGHGRIGDLDALRCENADFDTYNDYCIMFDEIEAAETIIGADKLENEEA